MDAYISIIKERLSEKRYRHSLSVSKTARELAEIFSGNAVEAEIAGILHDYAKDMTPEELLAVALENKLVSSEIEKLEGQLLHGTVGAFLVKRDLKIENRDILNAIKYHTTARKNMSLLEKIIYLSDMIEESRDYPGVELLRTKARENLDEALILALNHSLTYLVNKNFLIHESTIDARNFLLLESRGGR